MSEQGTIEADDGGVWTIRFERRLRHAPARVWEGLADPVQQAGWAPGVRIEAVAGGAVVYDFDEEGRADGEVTACEPQRVLEHTWRWPGEPDSLVRWELHPDGDGTRLVLLHRSVRPEPAAVYATGWHAMLDAFGARLDGRDPGEPDWEALGVLYSPS